MSDQYAFAALRVVTAHDRRHLCAQQFDRAHDPGMLDRADAQLQQQALVPEDFMLKEDLLDYLVGRAHEVSAAQGARRLELLARDGRPAAFAADLVHHDSKGREIVVGSLLRVVADEPVRVDANR